jgi:hypothetical protein
MKVGFRTPSIKKRIAARTSVKRYIRHSLGVKAPRGYGWVTNPKKYVYNKVYRKTTTNYPGCIVVIVIAIGVLISLFITF